MALQQAGFGTSVLSCEEFQEGNLNVFPMLPAQATVIYRGWMLSAALYEALIAGIKKFDAEPLTDKVTYLSTHHFPNWYPLVSEFTPETRIFPAEVDLAAELRGLNWPEYFIKDYVKSLKTSIGSRISSPEQAAIVVEEMQRCRGTIEGGYCVRRTEDFLPETEKRYFVLDGIPYSMGKVIPDIVKECARRIQSRFFSVDIVQRKDGGLRLVELGDGQVSDLTGWTTERFGDIFAECFGSRDT